MGVDAAQSARSIATGEIRKVFLTVLSTKQSLRWEFPKDIKKRYEAAMSKKKKCRARLEKKTCPMEVNNKVLTMLIKARNTWMKLPSNPTHWLRESIWSYSLSSKRVKPNLDGKSVFNNTKKPNIKLKSCPKQKMITQVKRWLRRGAASREDKWYCRFIYWK